jgi:hypothetical protein
MRQLLGATTPALTAIRILLLLGVGERSPRQQNLEVSAMIQPFVRGLTVRRILALTSPLLAIPLCLSDAAATVADIVGDLRCGAGPYKRNDC